MTIEDRDAVGTSRYKGNNYFCSRPCKVDFDKDPESVVAKKVAMPKMEELGEIATQVQAKLRKVVENLKKTMTY